MILITDAFKRLLAFLVQVSVLSNQNFALCI